MAVRLRMRSLPSVLAISALTATCAMAQWPYASSVNQDAEAACMYLTGDPFLVLRKSAQEVKFVDGDYAVVVSAQPLRDVLAEFPSYRPKVVVRPDGVITSEDAQKVSFLNGTERVASFVNRFCNWRDREGNPRPGGYAIRMDLYEKDVLVRTLMDLGSKNNVTRVSSPRCNNIHLPTSRDDEGNVMFTSEATEMPFGSLDTIIEYDGSERRAFAPADPWKEFYAKVIRSIAKEARERDDAKPWVTAVAE